MTMIHWWYSSFLIIRLYQTPWFVADSPGSSGAWLKVRMPVFLSFLQCVDLAVSENTQKWRRDGATPLIYDEQYIKIPYFGILIHRNIEIYMNILHNLTHRKIHFPIYPEKYILTHSLTQRRKSRFPSTWIIPGSFLFAWSFLAYPWFSHLGWGWNNVISSHMLQSCIYIYDIII